jgi:23S rRNA maturation mini-RNase III
MTQSQFRNKVLTHYWEACNKKRFHKISNVIKTIEERKAEAEKTIKKLSAKMGRGTASKKQEIDFWQAMASLDAVSGLLYDTKKIREEIFEQINEIACLTEPTWNGREPLREPVNGEAMYKILNNL